MRRPVHAGDRIDSLTLSDVDGQPVELAARLTSPAIVPLVRYFGCMPCQAYLRELETKRELLEGWGFVLLGVGGAADYQARHLMANGIGFPLLLDPEHRLYETLNIHRIRWWKLLSPATWWKYLRSARHARQGRITDHPLQAPGLVILGTDGTIHYLYRGETLGDYPALPELIETAKRIAATAN
ncbi:peroxiredoxin-like family protein [Haloechinothrix halophila]|uniref:peroxiredoxin-like family protein n=1 Tax=Haloechinothrix halophila TaxID=1069073 RepID=UPI00042A500F|nr:peroxiredoxin-like family protein [Haloechinothrix halophila]